MGKKSSGRPQKESNKLKDRIIGFRLSPEEFAEFDRIYKHSGVDNMSHFIKGCVFNQTIKVVKIDDNALEFYKLLVNLQAQYRAIGNNYNQATKAIKTAFTDKKALAFSYQLRDATLELINLNKEILQLTKELKQWLQK